MQMKNSQHQATQVSQAPQKPARKRSRIPCCYRLYCFSYITYCHRDSLLENQRYLSLYFPEFLFRHHFCYLHFLPTHPNHLPISI